MEIVPRNNDHFFIVLMNQWMFKFPVLPDVEIVGKGFSNEKRTEKNSLQNKKDGKKEHPKQKNKNVYFLF